jgi:signal recognition particle receptor subunit beta
MVQINFAKGEVQCKIVYYGPACAGKTANLHAIHGQAPAHVRGALTTIATDTNRTLFFDFLPLNLGSVAGIQTKLQLYAVPYKENQNSLRVLVLQGVDGLVFVADCSKSHLENRNAFTNLQDNLRALGRDPRSIPIVFQWNKSDLPNVHAAAEMNQALNPGGQPAFAACATTGMGVFATLKALTQQVLLNVSKAVAGREAVERVVATAPELKPPPPAPEPEPVPPPRMPLPDLEDPADPEPDWVVDPDSSPLDVLTPPFVAEPEPEPLPPLEPEPAPMRAPAMEFEEVGLPGEPAGQGQEAPFVPPWHRRQPEGPAVRRGSAATSTDTREFGRTTTSFEERPLPPLPPSPPATPPPPPPPPAPPEETYAAGEAWQAEEQAWPVEEAPAAPEAPAWDDAPPRARAPSRPHHVRLASAPYGAGWSAIDAHGRRRVTHERRDARPVVDRRARPRATQQRSNELPLINLVTGSLVALACLIVTGFLVHTLL